MFIHLFALIFPLGKYVLWVQEEDGPLDDS
jgi:hypothetical protein